MKKNIGLMGVVATVVLAITGFSVGEVTEYLQVARNNVNEAIRDGVPLHVEIDRMELLLRKMDQQVTKQKYQVAKAQVALEDAEAVVSRDRQQCEGIICDMRKLRNLQCDRSGSIQVGCHKVTGEEVRRVLAHKLKAYETMSSAVSARTEAVQTQRQAYETLATRYQEWNQQRELLSHRLETLRSRSAAQQANANAGVGSFDTSELARATKLADQIENKLRVVEKQQALGSTPIDNLLDTTASNIDIEAEVDRLLSNAD